MPARGNIVGRRRPRPHRLKFHLENRMFTLERLRRTIARACLTVLCALALALPARRRAPPARSRAPSSISRARVLPGRHRHGHATATPARPRVAGHRREGPVPRAAAAGRRLRRRRRSCPASRRSKQPDVEADRRPDGDAAHPAGASAAVAETVTVSAATPVIETTPLAGELDGQRERRCRTCRSTAATSSTSRC